MRGWPWTVSPTTSFLGWCSLTRWNPDYRSAALGYCLGDAAWGHGYATEAARSLLQWAFDTLDLNRVQAETDTRNAASARVLEKLGFVREGTLREDCVVNGDVSDSWVYGLLRRGGSPAHSLAPELTLRPVLTEIGGTVPGRGLYVVDAQHDDPAAYADWLAATRPIVTRYLKGRAA